MRIARNAFRFFRAGLACIGLVAGANAFAADSSPTGFIGSLSPDEKTATGVNLLSPAQSSALDAQVAQDVALAREGDVSGFSTTFLQRRTVAERTAAGLSRLNGDQQSRLDTLVARAIATPPFGEANFVYQPKAAAPLVPIEPKSLEVHGDLSLTVGSSKAGSFYGTSADITLSDPNGRYSITLGYSTYRGKGLFCPDLPLIPAYAPLGPPIPSILTPLSAPLSEQDGHRPTQSEAGTSPIK